MELIRSFNLVDQYLNNRQNEILWNLLANPANNGHLYAYNLQSLVNDFPQSGLLHVLLTRSDSEQNISHASAYFNPRALYNLVNSPDGLAVVTEAQIIQQLSDAADYAGIDREDSQLEEDGSALNNFSDAIEEEQYVIVEQENNVNGESNTPAVVIAEDEKEEVESIDNSIGSAEDLEPRHEFELAADETEPVTTAAIAEDSESVEPILITSDNKSFYEDELVTEAGGLEEEENVASEDVIESPINEHEIDDITFEEINEVSSYTQNIREDESITEASSFELAEPPRGIDDDVYNEIVSIEDISFAQKEAKSANEVMQQEEPVLDEEELPGEAINEPAANTTINTDRVLNADDEAEKLILGNIAATDYFVFDKAVNDRRQAEAAENNKIISSPDEVIEPAEEAVIPEVENQEVSKYYDDTLPYTFMWWLSKTRKEHAGVYQPFKLDTSQAIRQQGADELQQQYYENIFHLNSVEELDRSTSQQTVEFDLKNKEDRLIKRFIVEEPHIGTPSSDKLDTENKARKSAEDQDELVTETLARIYTDQMLYHKAINTYKKLMLKFPEKSRYFADQIQQLERKTN